MLLQHRRDVVRQYRARLLDLPTRKLLGKAAKIRSEPLTLLTALRCEQIEGDRIQVGSEERFWLVLYGGADNRDESLLGQVLGAFPIRQATPEESRQGFAIACE